MNTTTLSEHQETPVIDATHTTEHYSDDEISHKTEMSLEQCKDVASGMLSVLDIRLQSANESKARSHITMLWKHEKYVQLLTLMRVLQCHYKSGHPLISECFEQISELVNSIVEELGLRNDHDYMYHSLEGALSYITLCFRDNNLANSEETTNILYNQFIESWGSRNYYKMFGMLLSFQTLFQDPEKNIVYDIIYEHLVTLCPGLEEDDESESSENSESN